MNKKIELTAELKISNPKDNVFTDGSSKDREELRKVFSGEDFKLE